MTRRYLSIIIILLIGILCYLIIQIYSIRQVPEKSIVELRIANLQRNRVSTQAYVPFIQKEVNKDLIIDLIRHPNNIKNVIRIKKINRVVNFYDSANFLLKKIELHKSTLDSAQFYLAKFNEHVRSFEKGEHFQLNGQEIKFYNTILQFPEERIVSSWIKQPSDDAVMLTMLVIADELDYYVQNILDSMIQ